MNKKAQTIIIIVFFIAIIASVSGCSGPGKIAATVGPTATPVAPTVTPSPTAAVSNYANVTTTSDGATLITGNNRQTVPAITFDQGVYIVSWSSTGSTIGASMNDVTGSSIDILAQGQKSGQKLFVIDGNTVQPGSYVLSVQSDGDWNFRIWKPDTTSPESLPLKPFSSIDDSIAISSPFQAHAGDLKVDYLFSQTLKTPGSVEIYEVSTGLSFHVQPMMANSDQGESIATVPHDGIYIAQVKPPSGSGEGSFTIKQ